MDDELTFKNPFTYTHADASQYLLDHGAGLREERWNADPTKINFSNKEEFVVRNGVYRRSEFVLKYGLWAIVEDELYKMQLKIFDIELHDRCFREYRTRHDIYMSRRDEDYRECVDDEPYYCRWERKFYSHYILDHKDMPVIDVLMAVPTAKEVRALIDHEMFEFRVIRPIIDDAKITNMIRFFRRYMTLGMFDANMSFKTDTTTFTLEDYRGADESSRAEMRAAMGLTNIVGAYGQSSN
jgi:hypothetical protein